jgi:hypothetical protein
MSSNRSFGGNVEMDGGLSSHTKHHSSPFFVSAVPSEMYFPKVLLSLLPSSSCPSSIANTTKESEKLKNKTCKKGGNQMKIITLLGLTAVFLYLPMNYQVSDRPYVSSDAIAQNMTWGIFKREKEEETKVDGKIRDILEKINASGMTRSNIQDFSPEEFSTLLVKVNKQGDVQVYVYVTDVNEGNISKLKENGLQVEIVNEKYKVVQGWLPFDRVEEVSELDFVVRITASAMVLQEPVQ